MHDKIYNYQESGFEIGLMDESSKTGSESDYKFEGFVWGNVYAEHFLIFNPIHIFKLMFMLRLLR